MIKPQRDSTLENLRRISTSLQSEQEHGSLGSMSKASAGTERSPPWRDEGAKGDVEGGLLEPLLGRNVPGEHVDVATAVGVVHVDRETQHSNNEADKAAAIAVPPVGFFELFFFADKLDCLLMVVGAFCAAGAGVVMPLFSIIFGDILDAFHGANPTKEVNKNALYFVYLACASFVLNAGANTLYSIAAERQIRRMRLSYLQSALRQEIGWFDTTKPGELSTRIKGDTLVVKEGIGLKLARGIQFVSMFISGFTIGFVRGWELALVMLAVVPPLGIAGSIMFKMIGSLTTATQSNTAEAGGIAEEVISSIRTVAAFTGEKKEIQRYDKKQDQAMATAIKAGVGFGVAYGVMMFIIFSSYGLGMWYGAREVARDIRRGCVGDGCKSGGDVLTVFWAVLQGAMSIGQMGPNIQAVAEARGAAGHLLAVCHRQPAIDASSEEGVIPPPESVHGRVELRGVHFAYPSRPKEQVFQDFNLEVKPGTTVAIVGASGAGKSTVVSLLERFYDPNEGAILLDGIDIKDLNIQWLRSQLGLVSQEPVLFAQSIFENIAGGREGATRHEVEEAARLALAYDFITEFPDGFETEVGERGVQLSGGQKQRVAIARAILKDPAVLLLDEATSALDVESEQLVQAALDRLLAMKRGTTIVIAHRLSTIRNADKICVVENGQIVETGTHDELIGNENGKYLQLVRLQLRGGLDGVEGLAANEDGSDNDDDDNEHATHQGELVPLSRYRSRSDHANSTAGTTDPGGSSDVTRLARDESNTSRTRLLLRTQSYTSSRLHSEMSDTAVALLKEEMLSGKVPLPKVDKSRLWALSRPERHYLLLAFVAATFSGCVFPVFSLLLSTIISFFYLTDADELQRKASFWALMFVVLATGVGISFFVQVSSFTQMGERFTDRLRKITFRGIVRQDIAFFDDDENSTGSLTARLATEAKLVKNVVGQNLSRMYQNMINIIAAFVISFVFGSPLLTLVMAGIMPLLIFAGMMQMKVVTQTSTKSQESVAKAGKVAVQAIDGIRTVASFNLTGRIMKLYNIDLVGPLREGIKRGLIDGFSLGLSSLITLGAYGFVFWWGGHRVIAGKMEFERMLKSLMAIMMAAQGVGQTSSFISDSAAATAAAARIFLIVDRKPTIDSADEGGQRLPSVEGRIELRKVRFRYPQRPEALVFRNFRLRVEAGTTVALVGASGSGKSTVVNMVLRFYDPETGGVLLDGVDIRTLNLKWLRSQIGLVSQEPVLFATSIADNIAYGRDGATREEIEVAAQKANAHDFVSSFPDGYETAVGDKGVQLSGGQKQRIAIARAILKDPAILLLDEATSALDMESERLVQQALDQLVHMRRRTTIVIAHRLSTVRKCDKICVVHAGTVVEEGSHEELMVTHEGRYKALVDAAEGKKAELP